MFHRSIRPFVSVAAAVCLMGLANGCSDPVGGTTTTPPQGTSCIGENEHRVCINWDCVKKVGGVVLCTAKQPAGVPLPLGKYPCSSSNGGLYCPPVVDVGGGVPDCKAMPDLLACKMPSTEPGTGGNAGAGTGGVAGSAPGTGGAGVGGEGGGNDGVIDGEGTGGAVGGSGTGGSVGGSGTGGSSEGTGTGGSVGGSGTGGSSEGTGTGGSVGGSGTGGSAGGDGSGGSAGGDGSGGSAGGDGSGGSAGGDGSGGSAGGDGSGGSAGGDGSGGSAGGDGSGGSQGGSGGAGGGNETVGCTRTQGYWKTHANAWPVDALVVGQVTYQKAELIALLMTDAEGDASVILGYQLVAALLNQAAGASVPAAIANAVSAAQLWMETHKDGDGRLPYGVSPNSPDGSAAVALGSVLDDFNNGRAGTPHCR